MDLTEKNLIKLLAYIEAYSSDKFVFKPYYYQKNSSMFCFEILVSNKYKGTNDFACTFFFDCNTAKIYLEDYGTLFTSHSTVSKELIALFSEVFQLIAFFLSNYPELGFKLFQTTSRIPEKFDFLKELGFEQKEQLNHYENFKFIKYIH